MINEETFASRLTSLREQKKVSAREMSLDLGQNGSYINRIENRKAFPSMQCFFYICDYLQISPAAFFDDTTKAPHALDALTELLKTLSIEQLEIMWTGFRIYDLSSCPGCHNFLISLPICKMDDHNR